MEAKRSRNSATEGTDSAGYILATSWTKVSYLSRKSFCNSFGGKNNNQNLSYAFALLLPPPFHNSFDSKKIIMQHTVNTKKFEYSVPCIYPIRKVRVPQKSSFSATSYTWQQWTCPPINPTYFTTLSMSFTKKYSKEKEAHPLTPDKLDFNVFRRSAFDSPTWKGI